MLINAKSSLQAVSWSKCCLEIYKTLGIFISRQTLMRMSSCEIGNLKLHLYKHNSLWKFCSDISVSSERHYFAQAVSVTAILNVREIPWHSAFIWGRRDGPGVNSAGNQLGKNKRLAHREHLGEKRKAGWAAYLGTWNSYVIGSESEDGLIPRVQNSGLGLWSRPKQFSVEKPPLPGSSQVSVEEQKVLRVGVLKHLLVHTWKGRKAAWEHKHLSSNLGKQLAPACQAGVKYCRLLPARRMQLWLHHLLRHARVLLLLAKLLG